ncbi:MAG: FKBP-type peptidyl-prolyl cis-trans isomerase [Phycisphaeraceae bacterium]|nr:FKBP-type peptidyl-prolyl cis-trans isomerase [Phycisphaeraceae bacterium]
MSYMLGMNMANLVKNMPMTVEIDQQLLLRGLEEGLKDTSPLSVEARQQLSSEISGIVGDKIRQQQTEFAEKNVAYLNEYKTKSGVTTTASGLQYRVLAGGSGASPGPTDTVTVHYRARLIDGTEFDSSFSRNEPAKFPINQVIPGWQEALQMMKKGAKWELVIPPNLAYGERGIPQVIPPNAVLVFEVELLEITPLQLQ